MQTKELHNRPIKHEDNPSPCLWNQWTFNEMRPGSEAVAVSVLQNQWSVQQLSSIQVQWSSLRGRLWSWAVNLKLEIMSPTSGCWMISFSLSLLSTMLQISISPSTGQWNPIATALWGGCSGGLRNLTIYLIIVNYLLSNVGWLLSGWWGVDRWLYLQWWFWWLVLYGW